MLLVSVTQFQSSPSAQVQLIYFQSVCLCVCGQNLPTQQHHNCVRCSHETSQVCRWEQNEGRVQRWMWFKPRVLWRPLSNCVICGCRGKSYCVLLFVFECAWKGCSSSQPNHYWVVMCQNVIKFTGLSSQDGL